MREKVKSKKKIFVVISIIAIVFIIAIVNIANKDTMLAYYTSMDKTINKFKVSKVQANVEEPGYTDNQILKPNSQITKDPTLSNTGEIQSYIRAQVYVPITKNIRYVDQNENVVTPQEEIEIVSYAVNSGWELVSQDGFSGVVQDKDGNKYKVYTYKYMEDGEEKKVQAGEKIDQPVFSKIKVINYLDLDKAVKFNVYVKAIATQANGESADEMWTYYKNQNKMEL